METRKDRRSVWAGLVEGVRALFRAAPAEAPPPPRPVLRIDTPEAWNIGELRWA